MKSIKFLTVTSDQLDSIENVIIMIESLSKDIDYKNERYTWYSSTNIEFNYSVVNMKSRYCSMALFFAIVPVAPYSAAAPDLGK